MMPPVLMHLLQLRLAKRQLTVCLKLYLPVCAILYARDLLMSWLLDAWVAVLWMASSRSGCVWVRQWQWHLCCLLKQTALKLTTLLLMQLLRELLQLLLCSEVLL